MGKARLDGRFSTKRNDFKKSHPYHDHTYARVRAHSLFSGNQQFVKSKSTEQPPLDRQASCQAIQGELWHVVEAVTVLTHGPVKSPDTSITQFLTPDDLSKYFPIKVIQKVAEPILKKLVDCIIEGKRYSDTLETYALEQGRTPEWLKKQFSDEQINTIRQNPDCGNFDLTLKIKCIEMFKDLNQTVNDNKTLNQKIVTTLKNLKPIRNNLCHNRENYTKLQCHDIVNNLRIIVAELLEIIHPWDKSMAIINEKKKIETVINEIMIGGISKEDLRYMCLLKVINSVVEPTLDKVTPLICSEKKNENFKEYLLGNGMTKKKYKDSFFKEEKKILECNTDVISLDVTLHAKIIGICKDWHHTLKDDFPAKEELTSIIKKIRGIRNNVSHNMLSISPVKCSTEANGLKESLKDLRNFMQTKIVNMEDVIDINQIYTDIDSIMSVPYPLIGF